MENGEYIVAIDLGTNTVVAVAGTKDENGKIGIIDSESVAIPAGGMVRGEIKNIELVSGSIKKAAEAIEQRHGIRINNAYVGISGQHIRSVKQPYYVFSGHGGEIRQEDVKQLHDSMRNVPAPEGEKILQIIPQNYIVDDTEETSCPVGTFGSKLASTFNIILGDTVSINRLEMAFKRVEIDTAGIYLNAIASGEAVLTPDEKEEGVAVVDLGAGTTDVTVYYKNIIRHVGIVPIGGNSINKDIRSVGILEKHVEALKTNYGEAVRDEAEAEKFITTPGLSSKNSKEISMQNLAAIIEARLAEIYDFVIAEIKKSGCYDKLGAGVVLTGGGSQLKNADLLFKRYTGLDTRVAGAEANLDAESADKFASPAMATAIGLLMRAADDRDQHRTTFGSRPVAQPRNPFAGRADGPSSTASAPSSSNQTPSRRINDMYKQPVQSTESEELEDEQEKPVAQKQKKPRFISSMITKIKGLLDEELEDDDDTRI